MAAPSQSDPPSDPAKLGTGERVLLEPTRRVCACITASVTQRPITPEALKRAEQAIRRLRELFTFGIPAGPDLPREELEAGRDALAKLQSPAYAYKIFLAAGEHRRGRPVKRRHVAAKALEAKQQNPRLTRFELAQQFCPCGKARHNTQCVERLRRDMQRLSALIRRILGDYPA